MKFQRLLSAFFVMLVLTASLQAQAPQRFTYQAVVRDAAGALVAGQTVGLRISIVQSAPQGVAVYSEVHQPVTNENGLFTILVGGGQVQLGQFEAIRWGEGPYYIKSEVDPQGGINYTMEASQQLVSVPYALHAVSADSLVHPVNYDSIVNTAINTAGFLLSEQQVLTISNDTIYLTGGSFVKLPAGVVVPSNVSAFINDAGYVTATDINNAGYLTSFTEQQTLSAVTALGNSAGNKQLKELQDPTEAQDAVTYHLLQDVQNLIISLQQRMDSLNHVVDSINNAPAAPTAVLPTLTTTAATDITATGAVSGGNITSDGGAAVTARGVCWGTTSAPTISNCLGKTTDGTGAGSFSSTITGLTAGTTYYVRAYATNSVGTAYGDAVSFTAQEPCSNTTGGSTVAKGDNGALSGLFSVADGRQVHFAAGNLQYTTTGTHACKDGTTKPGTWCFAANQYDYIGCGNASISSSYTGYIDLFGWGTSGYNDCNPYLSTTSYSDYGPSGDIAGTNYDWGVYNAISNGGNVAGKWRTLTRAEWDYLCNTRTNAASKHGHATVNGVHGVVLLPDNWTLPSSCTFTSGYENGWTTNNYTTTQWEAMEGAGALFLPAAGCRVGATVHGVGSYGLYWSSTANGSSGAYDLYFDSGYLHAGSHCRYNGQSVRLVCDNATVPTLTTTAVSDITATGAVSGGNITSDGGAAVTARGVCWGTSSTPTVSSCLGKTTDGTGTGSFSSTITGLTDGITYYVRAYATNSVGTAYGDAVSFTAQEPCSNTTGGSTITKGDNGALPKLFSVASGKQVYFASGNLQYTTTGTHACADGTIKQGTWCFAANQYDYIGCGNDSVSSSYTGYIDLFGWGTSGYNGCNPYLSTQTNSDYGPTGDIAGTNYDWGVYNAISNGGNVAGKWRTLTRAEWDYLCNTRTNASSKQGNATVNGVHGVVFLPDSWTLPSSCTFTSGWGNGWTTNNYTTTQWAAMEGTGALFLPAAGYRYGTTVNYVGSNGLYWSSTANGSSGAYYLYVNSGYVSYRRYSGQSVRLVCDNATVPTLTTTAVSDITATGAVSGGNITSDGGAAVTARGVCWGTSSTPTVSSCLGKTTDGTGTGSFSSTITGLTTGTTYYVRAYATNSVGTAYGDAVSFTAQEPCSNTTGGSTVTKGDNGALSGLFSVADGKQVHFAAGNLQYTTTGTHACADGTTKQGTWCFAANQYDYIGCGNESISSSYTGYIDLFGWGTSGYSGCNPYLSTRIDSDYGPSLGDIAGTNYDWGVYNAISNGGNVAGKWRTLTLAEWDYLHDGRTNASSKRGHATVNGVHGVVFLPDSWTTPSGCTFTSGNGNGWTTNNYTTTQWEAMEGAGALFLPAAGDRFGTAVYYVGSGGFYWSSTAYGSSSAYYLVFKSGYFGTYGDLRYYGFSVRLVCDNASLPTLTTTAVSDITATGAVSGGNITSDGGAAVTARGVCWGTSSTPTVSSCLGKTTDGTGTGSFSSTITGLTAGTTYYVRAYATNSVGTAYGDAVSFTASAASSVPQGAMSGLFSVSATTKVYFSQGNLQYTTTGTHACADGTTKSGTWRFAEHQYDYVGNDNANISSSYTGYIDLFGWGTSGYIGCNPYLSTTSYSDYGPSGEYNLTGSYTNYDWGVYNAISNGGNVAGKWRTLTKAEWEYLYKGRINASSKRGYATVNGVHGVVLLPDSWTLPSGCTFTSGYGSGWTTNNYTTTQWEAMEGAGALFLPAAGYRNGTAVYNVGSHGYYWSSTANGSSNVYYPDFDSGGLYTGYCLRYYGQSVRLVCE